MNAHNQPISEQYRSALQYVPETGALLWKATTGPRCRVGAVAGSIDTHGYRQIKIHGKTILAHRIVWAMFNDRMPLGRLDHINGNRLDNRIENLREVTDSQSAFNIGMKANNTTGAKGVCYRRSTGRWLVQIGVGGRKLFVGSFASKEEAITARADAEAKHYPSHRREA